MPEHALPELDLDGDGEVDDIDSTDPVELIEVEDANTPAPPPDWDAEAHAEEYAEDPAVVVDPTGDDTPEAA